MVRVNALAVLGLAFVFAVTMHALGQDVRGHSWGDSSAAVLQREEFPLEKVKAEFARSFDLQGHAKIMGSDANVTYTFFDDKLCGAKFAWMSDFDFKRACVAQANKLGKPRVFAEDGSPPFAVWESGRQKVMVVHAGIGCGSIIYSSLISPTAKACETYRESEKLSSDSKDF